MKKRYIPLMTIIILLFIFIILSINNTNKKTYVYEIEDINTHDFMLKDFTMVSSNHSLFIPNTYYLEKVGNSKARDLSISLTHNEKEIMSWALGFDSDICDDLGEIFLKDLNINPKDKIEFRMKYTVDGKEEDFYKLINLNDCIKYSN